MLESTADPSPGSYGSLGRFGKAGIPVDLGSSPLDTELRLVSRNDSKDAWAVPVRALALWTDPRLRRDSRVPLVGTSLALVRLHRPSCRYIPVGIYYFGARDSNSSRYWSTTRPMSKYSLARFAIPARRPSHLVSKTALAIAAASGRPSSSAFRGTIIPPSNRLTNSWGAPVSVVRIGVP